MGAAGATFGPTSEAALIPGLVASLCAHGLFRAATKLACSWCEGEALTELVTVIAATLAARAALAQTRGYTAAGRFRGFQRVDGELGAGCAAKAAEAVAAITEPPPRTATASLASAGGVLGSEAIDAAAVEASPAAAWAALRAFLEAPLRRETCADGAAGPPCPRAGRLRCSG